MLNYLKSDINNMFCSSRNMPSMWKFVVCHNVERISVVIHLCLSLDDKVFF
jgi:hypothetical protein